VSQLSSCPFQILSKRDNLSILECNFPICYFFQFLQLNHLLRKKNFFPSEVIYKQSVSIRRIEESSDLVGNKKRQVEREMVESDIKIWNGMGRFL